MPDFGAERYCVNPINDAVWIKYIARRRAADMYKMQKTGF